MILALAAAAFAVGSSAGRAWPQMFTAAVALAVGAIPEGLPAAVTITLAIGVARMARRGAVIRRLPAVETLGSTTVICTDKTGTLTENQMTVRAVWTPAAAYTVTGSGYAAEGGLLGPTGEPAVAAADQALRWTLAAGAGCNDAALTVQDGRSAVVGDPTEGAMLVAARKAGVGLDGWRRTVDDPVQRGPPLHGDAARRPGPAAHRGARQGGRRAGAGAVRGADAHRRSHGAAGTCGRAGASTRPSRRRNRGGGRGVVAGRSAPHRDRPRRAARSRVPRRRRAGAGVRARLPEQKLRLVEALQARGHVVAMTGDGVNDAPALRQADIGVAMGLGGTEVAKDAADMVLTDDDFSTVEAAVEEGRGVFDNLTKFIVWTLPTNMGEGWSSWAILLGAALPIMPTQILWINMTTAVALGLMLAFEPKGAGHHGAPPRDPGRRCSPAPS